MTTIQQKTTHRYWRANWQREIEGAYLYAEVARLARQPEVKRALAEMAAQEKSHAALWAEHIHADDAAARPPRPDLRVRFIAWLARWLGAEAVLGLLIQDEVGD